jgi:hypothetical protein
VAMHTVGFGVVTGHDSFKAVPTLFADVFEDRHKLLAR